MTIYTQKSPPVNYRKIYENSHGPIPKDGLGRSYHIHHIDGNRQNNDISNLIALSIQDHYDVHYSQGDWMACARLGQSLNMSSHDLSEHRSRAAKDQVQKGTHNFLGGEIQRKSNRRRVEDGSHHCLKHNDHRLSDGTHHFLGGEIQRKSSNARVAAGTNPFVKTWVCEHCGKNGKGISNYSRYHGDKCKNHPDPILREQNILNKFNANSEESIKKGIETKKRNGTYGLSQPEAVTRAIETRRRNGTLNTNTPESITKAKATKIKNGTTGRKEYSIDAQKETLKRNAKQCLHCGKTVPGNGLFTRWHGNNCKLKSSD